MRDVLETLAKKRVKFRHPLKSLSMLQRLGYMGQGDARARVLTHASHIVFHGPGGPQPMSVITRERHLCRRQRFFPRWKRLLKFAAVVGSSLHHPFCTECLFPSRENARPHKHGPRPEAPDPRTCGATTAWPYKPRCRPRFQGFVAERQPQAHSWHCSRPAGI